MSADGVVLQNATVNDLSLTDADVRMAYGPDGVRVERASVRIDGGTGQVSGSVSRDGRIGLNVIAGLVAAGAVAAARAIHQKSILSPWLLLGAIPAAVGLYLTF